MLTVTDYTNKIRLSSTAQG